MSASTIKPIIFDAALSTDGDVDAVCVVDVWRDHRGLCAELVAATDQQDNAIDLSDLRRAQVERIERQAIEIYKENRK